MRCQQGFGLLEVPMGVGLLAFTGAFLTTLGTGFRATATHDQLVTAEKPGPHPAEDHSRRGLLRSAQRAVPHPTRQRSWCVRGAAAQRRASTPIRRGRRERPVL